MVLQPVADLHDPAIALGRVRLARDEARLLHRRDRSDPPAVALSGFEIDPRDHFFNRERAAISKHMTRHLFRAGAAAFQRH